MKKAFTLIELVFSIVVVGLAVLSIPLIVRQSSVNTVASQNVFGYYNALTLLETIKNKPWDEANVLDYNTSGEYYILQTNDADNTNPQENNSCAPDTTKKDPSVKISSIGTKKGLGDANRRRMCDPTYRQPTQIIKNQNLASINNFDSYVSIIKGEQQGGTQAGNDIYKLQADINYVTIRYAPYANAVTRTINEADGIDKFLEQAAPLGNGPGLDVVNNKTNPRDVKQIKITLLKIDPNNPPDPNNPSPANDENIIATYYYYAANIGTDVPFSKDNLINP